LEDPEQDGSGGVSDLGARIVTPLIQSLQEEVMARLDTISIEDLCQKARSAGVDSGGTTATDFAI
ncbi:MAG: transcriptional regulator, partial [Alphaproteobacteria bacterium]|nr:transcriptional regulator [Alphaproteobacteria bacterium]